MQSSDNKDSPGVQMPTAEDKREGNRSTVTLVLSLIVVVPILIAGTVAYFWLRNDTDSGAPSQAPPVSVQVPSSGVPTDERAPKGDVDSQFDGSSVDRNGRQVWLPKNPRGQLLPQKDRSSGSSSSAPDGVMWQRVLSVPMPFSTSDGPSAMSYYGVPSGFGHTQAGAGLAAWQLAWRLYFGPSDLREQLMQTSIVFDTEHAEEQKRALRTLPDAQNPEEMTIFDYVPAAVKVVTYSDQLATIKFGVPNSDSPDGAAPDGGGVYTFTVAWTGDDWKLLLKGPEPALNATTTDAPFSESDGWSPW